MAKARIYVEGKADKQFIQSLLQKYISHVTDFDIDILSGIDKDLNVLGKRAPDFQAHSDVGGINLLIIDANGNCEARKGELDRIANDLGISFESFLLPNNSDNGNLETLLCEIINEAKQPIFDCFESYRACLKSGGYYTPGLKSKVFAYLETLYEDESDKRIKYESRDYLNKDHWNLDHLYLEPLKEFLVANIKL